MEKIEINKDACIGCGQCVHRHPEYIAFDEMVKQNQLEKKLNLKIRKNS